MTGGFLIRTFGCQMNEHDSERIAGLLESDGYARVEDAADARVVVLNTCAVRENADNRLYGSLGHLKPLKDANPAMRIVVAGCLAQKDQGDDPAARALGRRGRRAPTRSPSCSTCSAGPRPTVRRWTCASTRRSSPARCRRSGRRAITRGSRCRVGCDNHCTFCIVPLVRGPQRSRSLGDVLAEVQGLARQGVVEVMLLGQNVNTYGRDLTVPGSSPRPRFGRLLREVAAVEGIRRVRFTSPHPHDFTDDVVEAMADSEAVCEHIHFPMQSGSDRVLRAMRRSYRGERYLSWLDRIRDGVPGIAVTTDVIVGFPGETEEDFADTLEVVRRARFDAAFTFQYSPRPGTVAATLDEQVPKDVVQERFERLVALQEWISLERNQELVGRVAEILIEGDGRKGNLRGRTRTNKLVHVAGDLPTGAFADARVTAAAPHHLTGELVTAAA